MYTLSTAETGRWGEEVAAQLLCGRGYELLARNWRCGRYELDIVARRDGVLHFVEVKSRREGALTPPEAAATRRKFYALSRAARSYMAAVHWTGEVQFDLVAVCCREDGSADAELIEQAMEPHW